MQVDKLIAEDPSYAELVEIAKLQASFIAIIELLDEEQARRDDWERRIEAKLQGAG